jgi:hypothetical protein
VRRDVSSAVRLLIVPTLALGVVAAILPGRAGLAVRIYALVVAAVVINSTLKALRRAYPPALPLRRASARARRGRRRPAGLARLEDEAALGVAGAFDLHHRLRPRLRPLAIGLLSSRQRISLDGDPEAARAALGPKTWDLVRQDRPPPEDRLARGIPISELRSVVETLERT